MTTTRGAAAEAGAPTGTVALGARAVTGRGALRAGPAAARAGADARDRHAIPPRGRPGPLARRILRPSGRTPDRLVLIVICLVLLGLFGGLADAFAVRGRSRALEDMVTGSGPMAAAAVQVYRSLSDADAVAAGAFLAGGVQRQDLRERYRVDIARAAAALTTAATGAPSGRSGAVLATLIDDLPVYTGLVETARTNNLRDIPVGAAYLREASAFDRGRMLPAARELYRLESDRLAAAQRAARTPPWGALALGLLTLGALVAAQVHLGRRTRRLFNVGLVAATLAGLAAMVWLGVAALAVAGHTQASGRDGTAQIRALFEARTAALEARSDEALTLIGRGESSSFEARFGETATRLTAPAGLFARARAAVGQPETRAAVQAAGAAFDRWLPAHRALRRLDEDGDYRAAVQRAVGPDPGSTGRLADQVDDRLGAAIDQADRRFDAAAGRARAALSGAAGGVVVFMLLAVVAAVAGMWPRIAEYR